MRIVLQVFSTLFLVSLLLGSFLMVAVNVVRADDISEMKSNPFMGLLVLGVEPGDFTMAAMVWLLMALVTIMGIVTVFLKKHTLGLITGIALIVLLAITVVVQPELDIAGTNDPKYTGYGIAFFGAIGLLLLILLHTALRPKPQTPIA